MTNYIQLLKQLKEIAKKVKGINILDFINYIDTQSTSTHIDLLIEELSEVASHKIDEKEKRNDY